MLKKVYLKLHYQFGNILRCASKPWKQYSIKPEIATTIFGAGFGENGWHHIKKTFEEINSSQEIVIEETSLYRYLKNFCPASISDLVGIKDEEPLPLFIYPWGSFTKEDNLIKSPRNSRFCGPSTDLFIKEEFNRIISLYENIKKNGYTPMIYPHSFIGGTWLESCAGDKIFVVMQGNHRMAVLSYMNYKSIEVRTINNAKQIIREKDLKNWPLVRQNRCKEENARKIFNYFFENNGQHIVNLI